MPSGEGPPPDEHPECFHIGDCDCVSCRPLAVGDVLVFYERDLRDFLQRDNVAEITAQPSPGFWRLTSNVWSWGLGEMVSFYESEAEILTCLRDGRIARASVVDDWTRVGPAE